MTELVYEGWQPATRRSTTIEYDSDSRQHIIWQSQDTKPIVESAKALASNFDPHKRPDMVHVARIPIVMWAHLTRLGITRDPVAFRAWLNSREARQLRTDDGRKL